MGESEGGGRCRVGENESDGDLAMHTMREGEGMREGERVSLIKPLIKQTLIQRYLCNFGPSRSMVIYKVY